MLRNYKDKTKEDSIGVRACKLVREGIQMKEVSRVLHSEARFWHSGRIRERLAEKPTPIRGRRKHGSKVWGHCQFREQQGEINTNHYPNKTPH